MPLSIISGSGGGGGASVLNDLTDVDDSAKTVNKVLQYSGSNWQASDINMNEIANVDVTGLKHNDMIVYDGASQKFKMQTNYGPLLEYPLIKASANSTNTWNNNIASASYSKIGYESRYAFDGLSTTKFETPDGTFSTSSGTVVTSEGNYVAVNSYACHTITITLPSAVVVESMILQSEQYRHPASGWLQGSNNGGSTWTTLLDFHDSTPTGQANQCTWTNYPWLMNLQLNTAYQTFRIAAHRIGNGSNAERNRLSIVEWQIYARGLPSVRPNLTENSNVILSNPMTTGEVLKYDSTLTKFKNTKVNINELAGTDLTTTPPTTRQIIRYNGTNWVPSNDFLAPMTVKRKVTTGGSWGTGHGKFVWYNPDTARISLYGINGVTDEFMDLVNTSVSPYGVVGKFHLVMQSITNPNKYMVIFITSATVLDGSDVNFPNSVTVVGSYLNGNTFSSWTVDEELTISFVPTQSGGGGGSTTFVTLTDVDMTGVTHGDVVAYDSVSQKYKPLQENRLGVLVEYPMYKASSNVTTSFDGNTATHSVVSGTNYANNAFDGLTTTGWTSTSTCFDTTTGAIINNGRSFASINPCEWLRINLSTAIRLEAVSISSTQAVSSQRGPKSFAILASNDGSTWATVIDRLDGGPNVALQPLMTAYPITIQVNQSTAYSMYALCINRVGDSYNAARGAVFVGEWQLWARQDYLQLGQVKGVRIAGVSSNHYLRWDNSSTSWINGAINLVSGNVSDVTITAVADGHVLRYNNGTSKWTNQVLSHASLSDTTLSTLVNGQVLTVKAGVFQNVAPAPRAGYACWKYATTGTIGAGEITAQGVLNKLYMHAVDLAGYRHAWAVDSGVTLPFTVLLRLIRSAHTNDVHYKKLSCTATATAGGVGTDVWELTFGTTKIDITSDSLFTTTAGDYILLDFPDTTRPDLPL